MEGGIIKVSARDDELTEFSIGDEILEALCYIEVPTSFEAFDKPALSLRVELNELGEAQEEPTAESALSIARSVRQSIVELDQQLMRQKRGPTGDDYNQLYVLANSGLINVLKSLGDSTEAGQHHQDATGDQLQRCHGQIRGWGHCPLRTCPRPLCSGASPRRGPGGTGR